VAAVVAVLTTLATLAVVGVTPASASTVNGIATIANPSTDAFLASGGSNTEFTLTLPPSAHCDGDTASDGYHVWSYLVEEGTSISSLTFSETHEPVPPSSGLGLFDSIPQYYGPENTAITTGQIIGIPTDFEWGAVAADDPSIVPELLYSGGTSGVWEGGLACANSAGDLTDNWNTEITFTKNTGDPNGFVWSAVPGPHGSSFAAITSASSTSFTQGTAGSFTPTATGSPAPTITESGTLPAGVTFAGGKLSGTPTASGTFHITFTATNGIGNPAVQDFTLNVGSPPAITSANHVGFVEGTAGTFTVTATGTPVPTLSESGPLPTGVTFVPGTGVLSGTPTETGSFPITFTATNGIGTAATQNFTLTVGTAPTITSAAATTFTKGTAGSFTVMATGFPAPTFTETGSLPAGVTLNGTSGLLSGTPTQSGSFPIVITAANGSGPNATQNFTLTVDAPAAITSAASTTFVKGHAGSFTVTASGFPVPTLSESGALPAGVTFVPATGVLSGTPTVTGSFPLVFTATNGVGTAATQDFTLTVNALPAITSANATTFTKGDAGTFTVTATGTPAPTLSESGTLPTGVTFVPVTGVLSGTPTESGVFHLTFTAANGVLPNATQSFTLTVDAPPAFTSADSATFYTGRANTFTVAASGTPSPTFTGTGTLPSGVTLTSAGVLSGTPTATGSFPITLTATNGIGEPATQSFTLTISLPPLVISTGSLPAGTVGTAYSQVVDASAGLAPYRWSISDGALPAGLSLNAQTGTISGSPSAAGTADFTVEVTDTDGSTATKALSITITAPVVAPTTLTQPVVGIAAAPGGAGYWLTDAAGDVAPLGSVRTYGSLAGVTLRAPIVQIVATADGGGYWLVGVDGGVFAFGDAVFHGSTGNLDLNAPIVGMARTSNDGGYWLVGSDGGVFSFGDAAFHGSMGGIPLNKPVVGIATDSATGGYWLAAADGGIFSFDAPFLGSVATLTLNKPIVGVAATPDGGGYWLVGADGGVFNTGDARFHGSAGSILLNAPVTGMAADAATGGYWLVAADGGIFSYGAPFFGVG
jgi:hypothetical protein